MNYDTAHALAIPALKSSLKLYLHDERDQHVSKDIKDKGVWEAFETRLVIERLQPGDIFVDVGANIGYYSVIAASLVGKSGVVFAFEPEPKNFQLLKKNIAENGFGFVQPINAGLSDKNSAGHLFLNHSNWGDHQIYDNGQGRDSCDIKLINGAEFLANKVERIDLLKIDTQGAESQVIAGLLPLLQASQRLTIIIEFWPFGLRKAGSSGHQLLDMLASLKLPFQIIDHIDHQLIACSEQQLREWVDMLDDHPDDEGFMNIMLGQ